VVCCISDAHCSICSDVVDSFNLCGKTKALLKDIIPFCNGQMWPDLVFEIIQVALMLFSICLLCCCDGSSRKSHCDNDEFITFGMVVTCIVVVIDIIKIIISFVNDDMDAAVFELIMFIITLAIGCCLHFYTCMCNCGVPCIPGILCVAILQVAGEVVKHMVVIHNNEEMDGTDCTFL